MLSIGQRVELLKYLHKNGEEVHKQRALSVLAGVAGIDGDDDEEEEGGGEDLDAALKARDEMIEELQKLQGQYDEVVKENQRLSEQLAIDSLVPSSPAFPGMVVNGSQPASNTKKKKKEKEKRKKAEDGDSGDNA